MIQVFKSIGFLSLVGFIISSAFLVSSVLYYRKQHKKLSREDYNKMLDDDFHKDIIKWSSEALLWARNFAVLAIVFISLYYINK